VNWTVKKVKILFSAGHLLEKSFQMMYRTLPLKGIVQRKLRSMLLYIIWKLFSRRWSADNKILTFLTSSDNQCPRTSFSTPITVRGHTFGRYCYICLQK